MTDREIVEHFERRGFTVLEAPTRELDRDPELCRIHSIEVLQDKLRAAGRGGPARAARTAAPEDLVTLWIQSAQPSEGQRPFTVVFSRSHGRVVGEQD
jgi:hypothetical protein